MSWWRKQFGEGDDKRHIGGTTPFDSLVADLGHDDINISYPALQELQRRAAVDPSLVPRIAEAFASVMLYVSPDGKAHFNNAAVRAIGDLGPEAKSVMPKLVDLLHTRVDYSPRPGLRPGSLSAAVESVEQNLAGLKRCARETLRKIGTPEALAAVERDET